MSSEPNALPAHVNPDDYLWTDEVLDIPSFTLGARADEPPRPLRALERSLSTRVLDALEAFWRWVGLV